MIFLPRCSSFSRLVTNLSVLERLPVAAYQVDEGLQERPRDRLPDQILRAVQGPLQVGRHVARERREVVEGGVHFLRVIRLHVHIDIDQEDLAWSRNLSLIYNEDTNVPVRRRRGRRPR